MKFPELLPENVLERVRNLSTANLADGMASLNIKRGGCLDPEIMPVSIDMHFAGTAATVETEDGDNFPVHVAIYESTPGIILMIDGKGYRDRAYMGDLMVGAAKAIGIEGIVLDGYVRDKKGLLDLGLPVFSRGFMQRSPDKRGPGKINEVISCGGVTVRPGDLVVGDYDGVVVVPREHVEEVILNAEKKILYEKKREVAIQEYADCRRENKALPSLAPSWVTEMLNK